MDQELLTTIFAASVANVTGLAVLGFLAKSLVTSLLAKDLEAHKSQLKMDTDLAIAEYQSKLEQERIRFQISYAGIFGKQAEAILDIYKKVDVFHQTMTGTLHSDRPEDKENFLESFRSLSVSLDENRILLPEELDNELSSFIRQIMLAFDSHSRASLYLSRTVISDEMIEKMFKRQDKANEVLDRVPLLKADLMRQFRSIIGIVKN